MGTLYLVRHAQASFGAADYDQLSELGRLQSRRLGEWFARRGIGFDAVLTGTLRRHAQTLEGIEQGLQARHDALRWPGLDEYDSHALVHAIAPGPIAPARTPDETRQHFRLLRQGLLAWIGGRTQPAGMPSHAEFRAGVVAALEHVRQRHAGQNVLIVSSGGPISAAMAHVLGLGAEATVEINLHIRNSALTEFKIGPKRLTLIAFNTLPHLDADPAAATYA